MPRKKKIQEVATPAPSASVAEVKTSRRLSALEKLAAVEIPLTPQQIKTGSIPEQQRVNNGVYNKHGVRTLAELTGEVFSGGYNHKTEDEYQKFLEDLNLTDLQEEATKRQVLPNKERRALINILVKEFRIKNSGYFNSLEVQRSFTKKISKETEQILSQGR